jgi:ankyrin repeat protein
MKHPTASKALSLQNCFGATALHLTCAQSSVASAISKAVLLGSEGAASVQDKLGRTALHVCAQNINSTEELVRYLIHLYPGSLKVKMLSGSVPLQLAVKTKANVSVVKALYSAGVSFSNLSNKNGNTLLHDAVAHQSSLDVVRFLVDENSEAISAKNSFGNIPLHCAVLGQARSEIIEFLLKVCVCGKYFDRFQVFFLLRLYRTCYLTVFAEYIRAGPMELVCRIES